MGETWLLLIIDICDPKYLEIAVFRGFPLLLGHRAGSRLHTGGVHVRLRFIKLFETGKKR